MYLIYSIYAKKEENKIQIGRKHQFKVKANMGSQKKKKITQVDLRKVFSLKLTTHSIFFF